MDLNNIIFKDESYIFIDISNVYIGFYNNVTRKYKICNPNMDYDALFKILEKEKNIKKKVLIGSKNTKKYKKEKRQKNMFVGYEVHLLERINKEHGVDELLHEKIMETLSSEKPGTIMIASGDGKVSETTENSFYKICILALEKKWKVIIVSWKNQLSKNYILGPELYCLFKDVNIKNNFEILYLDDYLEELII